MSVLLVTTAGSNSGNTNMVFCEGRCSRDRELHILTWTVRVPSKKGRGDFISLLSRPSTFDKQTKIPWVLLRTLENSYLAYDQAAQLAGLLSQITFVQAHTVENLQACSYYKAGSHMHFDNKEEDNIRPWRGRIHFWKGTRSVKYVYI